MEDLQRFINAAHAGYVTRRGTVRGEICQARLPGRGWRSLLRELTWLEPTRGIAEADGRRTYRGSESDGSPGTGRF